MKKIMPVDEFRDALGKGALKRRDVVKTLAAVGVATVSTPLLNRQALAQDGWLSVFTWAGYEVPELHPAFLEKYGRSPDATIFATNDEALQKLRAGFKADIACPTSSWITTWIDADLLEPIDVSRLSNWNDIFPNLQSIEATLGEDGEHYYAPWVWGNVSVLFRPDLAPEYSGKENHTWEILWDPKYANRVANRDDWAATTITAGLVAGAENPFAMTDDEIERVKELLAEQRAVNRFYWSSETQAQSALATGEIVAMHAWNSSYAQLKAQGVPVEFMVPKEGLLTWVDGHVLLKTQIGTDEQRYDYLDATLGVEPGVFLIEEYAYGSSNMRSFEAANPDIVASLGMSDPMAVMEGSLWYEAVPPEIQRKLVDLHDEILAGI